MMTHVERGVAANANVATSTGFAGFASGTYRVQGR